MHRHAGRPPGQVPQGDVHRTHGAQHLSAATSHHALPDAFACERVLSDEKTLQRTGDERRVGVRRTVGRTDEGVAVDPGVGADAHQAHARVLRLAELEIVRV